MFGQVGIVQLLIIAAVVLIFFGRGRISEMMGDFGRGISSFKKGMSEDDNASKAQIEAPAKDPSTADTKTSEKSDTTS